MKCELYTLYWDNGSRLVESQKKVYEHFGVKVNYHHLNGVPHGYWMNEIMNKTECDVVGFIDNDCVITNNQIVNFCVNYALSKESFIGVAQSSNHIKPCSHIFAAPCFLFISRKCYEKLDRPSFSENSRSDVAEEFSYIAEENGVKYKALYPTHFERSPIEGLWALSNYGYYGIGTHFVGGIYHLYQGRYNTNVELFEQRCQDIIKGTFTTDGMINSLDFI
jgi:hypothetical protein